MKENFTQKLLKLMVSNCGALVIVLLLTVATAFASYDEYNSAWLTLFVGICCAVAHAVFSILISEEKINWKPRIIIYSIAVLLPVVGLVALA